MSNRPEEDIEEDLGEKMTLGDHLEELRKRLWYSLLGLTVAMVAALVFGHQLLALIEHPYVMAMTKLGMSTKLAMINVTGAFTMYLRISLYAGLIVSSPWIVYQFWSFIAAGLYPHEKRYANLAVPFSAMLFLAGAAFAIVLATPAIEFFVKFGDSIGIQPIITLGDYVDFITDLLLAFGLVFQMPLVVLVLAKIGLVTMASLRKYRKHVIVGIGAIAAVLAPPDLVSMLAMMVPMWLLYEFGILLAWLLVLRHKKPKAEEDEDEEEG